MQFLPKTKRNRQRILHHLWLAAIGLWLATIVYLVLSVGYASPKLWLFRWSLATAYISTALLTVTLSIGTWNLWRRKTTAVSSDLRRDFGIWCGIFAVAHTFIGLNVHQKSWIHYFLDDAGNWRTDLFGFVNYIGVAATLIVTVLLLTSNDFSLSRLKSKRWKFVQRWNYILAVLIALHGFLFILVENRVVPFLFIFAVFVIWVIVFQIIGFQKKRLEFKKESQ